MTSSYVDGFSRNHLVIIFSALLVITIATLSSVPSTLTLKT